MFKTKKFYTKLQQLFFFYLCTVHFEIYAVHSPTNALFINLAKSIKFTLKYTIMRKAGHVARMG